MEINLHQLIKFAPLFFIFSIALAMGSGWLVGAYRTKKAGENGVVVRDSLVGAIFGLAALVLGFTFSSASNHYDDFLKDMRNQASAIKELHISTKYLQPSDQSAIKKSLAELLDLRLAAWQNIRSRPDLDVVLDQMAARARQINEDVTKAVVKAPPENQIVIANFMTSQMQSLSVNFSSSGAHARSHPAALLLRFFYLLLCVGSLLIGYTMAVKRENDWFLSLLYIALMGCGFFVIFSLEFPNVLMPYEDKKRDLLVLRDWLRSN